MASFSIAYFTSYIATNFALAEYWTTVTFKCGWKYFFSYSTPRPVVYPSIPSIPREGRLHSGQVLSSCRNTNHLRFHTFACKQLQVPNSLSCACFWPGNWTHNLLAVRQQYSALQHRVARFYKRSFKKQKTPGFVRYFPKSIIFYFISLKRKCFLVV